MHDYVQKNMSKKHTSTQTQMSTFDPLPYEATLPQSSSDVPQPELPYEAALQSSSDIPLSELQKTQ